MLITFLSQSIRKGKEDKCERKGKQTHTHIETHTHSNCCVFKGKEELFYENEMKNKQTKKKKQSKNYCRTTKRKQK